MTKPTFVVGKSDRTPGMALRSSAVQGVRSKLLGRGFVLLPSDAHYSLVVLAVDDAVREGIMALSSDLAESGSLTFSGCRSVGEYIEMNPVTATILEQFTPGPVAVVGKSRRNTRDRLPKAFSDDRGMIRVRIPDSNVERDVANATDYPLASFVLRDPGTGEPVRSFATGLNIVGQLMQRAGAGWAAIEGNGFQFNSLTSVEVADDGSHIRLLEEGDIPFDAIRAAATRLPGSVFEDWG